MEFALAAKVRFGEATLQRGLTLRSSGLGREWRALGQPACMMLRRIRGPERALSSRRVQCSECPVLNGSQMAQFRLTNLLEALFLLFAACWRDRQIDPKAPATRVAEAERVRPMPSAEHSGPYQAQRMLLPGPIFAGRVLYPVHVTPRRARNLELDHRLLRQI